MAHLSQVIAVEKDAKEKAAASINAANSIIGNHTLFSGIARSYTPKDEDGEQLPPESTRMRFTVKQVVTLIQESLTTLFDVIATKDWSNCTAQADITVDGKVLLSKVPATYILFLEKQLAELHAFVKKLPTLDAAETWAYDPAQDSFATPPVETVRSKKVMRNHVLAEATDKHPAQVQVYAEDVPAGRWKTIKYSGAIQTSEQNAMLARIEKLQHAVKFAREEANRMTVTEQHVGATVLHYIFG